GATRGTAASRCRTEIGSPQVILGLADCATNGVVRKGAGGSADVLLPNRVISRINDAVSIVVTRQQRGSKRIVVNWRRRMPVRFTRRIEPRAVGCPANGFTLWFGSKSK